MGLIHRTLLLVTLAGLLAGCDADRIRGDQVLKLRGPEVKPVVYPKDLHTLHFTFAGVQKVFAQPLPEGLVNLNLSHNNLPLIPERFIPASVTRLWLADNTLTALPRSFCATQRNLIYLNLDRNRIEALPDLSALPIRWLRLNRNRLTGLPALPETLERLYLNNNRLQSLPDLPAGIKHLSLSGNPLREIPAGLGAGLEMLDLSYTHLTALPANLSSWHTLKELNLTGCPLPQAEKERIAAAFDPLSTVIFF